MSIGNINFEMNVEKLSFFAKRVINPTRNLDYHAGSHILIFQFKVNKDSQNKD